MARTDNLRRQHDAALKLVAEVTASIATWRGSEVQARRIGLSLARLAGLLRIHFAQEDKLLYPSMQQSDHAMAADTAARFEAEMGGLSAAFGAFVARWGSPAAIAADFPAFRDEARAVFTALGQRVERENTVLYPLADAIDPLDVRATA